MLSLERGFFLEPPQRDSRLRAVNLPHRRIRTRRKIQVWTSSPSPPSSLGKHVFKRSLGSGMRSLLGRALGALVRGQRRTGGVAVLASPERRGKATHPRTPLRTPWMPFSTPLGAPSSTSWAPQIGLFYPTSCSAFWRSLSPVSSS